MALNKCRQQQTCVTRARVSVGSSANLPWQGPIALVLKKIGNVKLFSLVIPSVEATRMAKDLLSSDGSDNEDGGAQLRYDTDLKVNEHFARKFTHNKIREELRRCMYPLLQ